MKDYSASHAFTTGGAFPDTAAVNASTPTTPDGTEYIKETLDDMWGARQALMDEANLTPDGVTEIKGASQQLDALIALFRQEKRIGIENNAVDAVNDLDFLAGVELGAITPFRQIRLAATLVKQIDANWAVGTNLGGFPSALTLTNGTWYHGFVISKADGTTDAGFDTSLTAANLLADATGYVNYRRVGSIYYIDGVTGIKPFRQYGNRFMWDIPVSDLSAQATHTTQTARTLSIPADIEIEAKYSVTVQTSTVADRSYFGLALDPRAANTAPIASQCNIAVTENATEDPRSNANALETLTDDGTVNFRWSTAGAVYNITTFGWSDDRAL